MKILHPSLLVLFIFSVSSQLAHSKDLPRITKLQSTDYLNEASISCRPESEKVSSCSIQMIGFGIKTRDQFLQKQLDFEASKFDSPQKLEQYVSNACGVAADLKYRLSYYLNADSVNKNTYQDSVKKSLNDEMDYQSSLCAVSSYDELMDIVRVRKIEDGAACMVFFREVEKKFQYSGDNTWVVVNNENSLLPNPCSVFDLDRIEFSEESGLWSYFEKRVSKTPNHILDTGLKCSDIFQGNENTYRQPIVPLKLQCQSMEITHQ